MMIKPFQNKSSCPTCHSSLKKVTATNATFCQECYKSFGEAIFKNREIKKDSFYDYSPKLFNAALKDENYELAAKITKTREINNTLPYSIFSTLSFYRNLDGHQFTNHERNNDTQKEIIKKRITKLNPEKKLEKNLKLAVNSTHHLTLSQFIDHENTKAFNALQNHTNQLDNTLEFAFSDDFGFLGPQPNFSGYSYSLKTTIALPHLFFDNQIPKLIKSCKILGFKLHPWLKDKSNPLIYVLENFNSLEQTPAAIISSLKDVMKNLGNAEKIAMQNQLKLGCPKAFNMLSSSYWSLGALIQPDPYKIITTMEDLYCASKFSYLSQKQLRTEKLIKNTAEKLFYKNQLFTPKPELDYSSDTFEKLLQSLQP